MSTLIQFSKSENPSRKNFRFEDIPGYESTLSFPYLVRICVVKLPRFQDGAVIGTDMYDLIQREYSTSSLSITYRKLKLQCPSSTWLIWLAPFLTML